jgi:CubicO group peptidase (beta-lactamase class C family)
MLRGEVHDDNAWACGGVAGHAGLFGTAADVFGLLSRLLAAHGGASGDVVWAPERTRRLLTPVGPGRRTPGFDVPSPPLPGCGRHFSPRTVGHLGFTGASFWMDLRDGVIVVLLTHRVHPRRWNRRIRAFRPALHDAVRTALGNRCGAIPGNGAIFRLSPAGLSDSNTVL